MKFSDLKPGAHFILKKDENKAVQPILLKLKSRLVTACGKLVLAVNDFTGESVYEGYSEGRINNDVEVELRVR